MELGIFGNEELLRTVQMAKLYPDSKTFVDKKLKNSPKRTEEKFSQLLKKNAGNIPRDQILEFVEANFDEEGLELEPWIPSDWKETPSIVNKLGNPKLIKLALGLNEVWKILSRKISDDVKACPDLYSIIYVPNGFVVPGGRFREFYYWDTYWIVKALLICDMFETVKGIIENFMIMVETYGLIPNGGRIYYIHRSQPPLLTLMVKEYFDYTKDLDFVEKHINTMEKEMAFWETDRCVKVKKENQDFTAFVFGSNNMGPRPESYREDFELAKKLTEREKEQLYRDLKAGAESGWDYSTRWMIDNKRRNIGGLKAVKTSYIVPVDLNCIMAFNYKILMNFHLALGNIEQAERCEEKLNRVQFTIDHLLWCEDDEVWYDYNYLHGILRKYFYPSNLFPLWTECFQPEDKLKMAKIATNYLNRTSTIFCKGGVPTSMVESGQQWDFPNAWPPLQHILVEGLLKTGEEEARRMALTIARRYTVGSMFEMSEESKQVFLFEKYNSQSLGSAGAGGEYNVQTGFGWSNGVVIAFMDTFGDELLKEDGIDEEYDKDDALQLVTQFDLNQAKSLLVRRNSSSALALCDLVNAEECYVPNYDGYINEQDDDEDINEDEGIVFSSKRRLSKPMI